MSKHQALQLEGIRYVISERELQRFVLQMRDMLETTTPSLQGHSIKHFNYHDKTIYLGGKMYDMFPVRTHLLRILLHIISCKIK